MSIDNLRLSIFREMASSARNRNEYIHQIKLTYGEEAVPEALQVYDNLKPENAPYQNKEATESALHNKLTLNLTAIAPALGVYQVPMGQLILIVDVVFFVLSFLFPPFVVTLSNGAITSLGYHLIFDPPTFQHVTIQPMSYAKLTGRIDVATLLAEWIFVAVVSLLVWKYLARKQKKRLVTAVEVTQPEDKAIIDAIVTPPKSPKLIGKHFAIGLSWLFCVLAAVNIGLTIAGGGKPPWNQEFFFSILCGTIIALYVSSGRVFAFVGGFLLSFPLLGLIGRIARALV